ncbi:hypothetical protein [Profundibacterium mesophilum]|uniref:DUF4142 domain-containing protein n=1 Tax=Profundibacterium mesophilum KAUST100406-0324 TaxID=1037889 RepID=A0A921NNZ1_9RHOB|nr:hypothetical protein [Profundibacterium mesophilum]KAF0674707.1 hypothetical protein PMES_03090 [Profundibacterium mesophilum KAUST100406-0324]
MNESRLPGWPRIRAAALAFATAAATLAGPLPAAEFDDPTWPCVQRKVEALSAGLMWPDPIEPGAVAPAASGLAERLALRRVDLEEAQAMVDAFAEGEAADRGMMGAIFAQVFERLARDRRAVIEGIGRYSLDQIALATRIDAARVEMDEALGAPEPDFDRIDAIEEQIAWDERIYTDRARALTYVCETPVLIEKRLYAIAQMLQGAAAD